MISKHIRRRLNLFCLLVLCLLLAGQSAWAARLNDTFLDRLPQMCLDEKKHFSFAWIGDVQINFSLFEQALGKMKTDPDISFLLVGGDMMAEAEESGFKAFLRRIENVPFPVAALPGNHDLIGDPNAILFRRYIGDGLTSFQAGNCYFILLWNTSGNIPRDVERDFDRVLLDLKRSQGIRHLFVCMHVPPFDPRKNAPGHSMNASSARRFFARLKPLGTKERSVTVLSAHVHGCFFRERDGVKVVVSGGGGGALYGKGSEFFHHYMKITVDGARLLFTPVRLKKAQKKR